MDESNNFDGQPSFTQQAAFPPSWTSADDLRFARKAAGLNQIKSDLDEGVVYPHQVAPLLNQLQGDMGEMSQRKAAFDQHQQQQQMQAALGQNAMQRAVEQQNEQHRASEFPKTVHVEWTPNGPMYFYPNGKGGMQQAQLPDAPQAAAGETGTGADAGAGEAPPEVDPQSQETAPLGPDGQPLTDQPRFRTVVGPDGVQREQRIPTLAERQAMDQATPEQQVGIAGQIGQGTFGQGQSSGGPMQIQNGPYTDQYQDGRLVASNRPPVEARSMAGFTPEETTEVEHAAAMATVGMRQGQHRDDTAAAARLRTMTDIRRRKAAAVSVDAKATAADKAVASREKLAAQKKEQTDHADRWLSNKNAHLGKLIAEYQDENATTKNGVTKKGIVTAETRKELEDRAKDMATNDHVDAFGVNHLPPGVREAYEKRHPNVSAPGGQTGEQPKAAAPQRTVPGTPAEREAELRRRGLLK